MNDRDEYINEEGKVYEVLSPKKRENDLLNMINIRALIPKPKDSIWGSKRDIRKAELYEKMVEVVESTALKLVSLARSAQLLHPDNLSLMFQSDRRKLENELESCEADLYNAKYKKELARQKYEILKKKGSANDEIDNLKDKFEKERIEADIAEQRKRKEEAYSGIRKMNQKPRTEEDKWKAKLNRLNLSAEKMKELEKERIEKEEEIRKYGEKHGWSEKEIQEVIDDYNSNVGVVADSIVF